MTGKEVAEICAKHKSCWDCELKNVKACEDVMREMEDGVPAAIFKILEKEYGVGERHETK